MQEAGDDATLKLALPIAEGLEYIRTTVEVANLKVNNVALILSFLWGIRMNFNTEISNMRAGRRMWSKLMKERYQPQNSKFLQLRAAHCQTSGYSLTKCQPSKNVVCTTMGVMAAVMGGKQYLHNNSYDEAVGLHTPLSDRVSCNTKLILREETGMAEVADLWGGIVHDGELDGRSIR